MPGVRRAAGAVVACPGADRVRDGNAAVAASAPACAGCGVTHVLLPPSVLARYRDEAGVIGAALELAAGGVSWAGIARSRAGTRAPRLPVGAARPEPD
jgi:hypothetical protein